ncbi:MAG TPA: DUF2163 domain-containing protein [Fimbriimonas sp.]|nr:DUF2163 domain-containing protein [Fimbriimonas sp.]
MRTVPAGLLDSPTRCIAVKVAPKLASVWGLTDANLGFAFEGVSYEPYNGVDASTIQQSTGTSAGNLQATTIQSAIASQITVEDLIGGVYEGARVWVYEIDYLNPGNGAMVLGQYVVAKATLHDSKIEIELQETLFRLKNVTGRTLSSRCDVATYGDLRCDPGQTIRARDSHSRTVLAALDAFTLDFSGDTEAVGFTALAKWSGHRAPTRSARDQTSSCTLCSSPRLGRARQLMAFGTT